MASVAFSVAYYLTAALKFMFPSFASLIEVLMSVFGSLAVSTLISLILRLPWWSTFFIVLLLGGSFKTFFFFSLHFSFHSLKCDCLKISPFSMTDQNSPSPTQISNLSNLESLSEEVKIEEQWYKLRKVWGH